jgi:hypothetical protein
VDDDDGEGPRGVEEGVGEARVFLSNESSTDAVITHLPPICFASMTCGLESRGAPFGSTSYEREYIFRCV